MATVLRRSGDRASPGFRRHQQHHKQRARVRQGIRSPGADRIGFCKRYCDILRVGYGMDPTFTVMTGGLTLRGLGPLFDLVVEK
ncbi:Basic endochitinase A [Acorus gramineus]|uniref:Basic endochitinase A n=1 Tax=Acorus gramineus TaxID=55184 RepID=A0AAV9AFE5_ACOGR|nr:Basic endochitinase A [Acorus gramineus]